MRWLELAPGYACNLRCTGCFSQSTDARDQMSSEQALRWLQFGRSTGARHVWFGGGEPTLRRDFLPLLRAAHKLGYERIKVQTNGLLFAYPEFVKRATDAGMTETNLLLRSVDARIHDEASGREGAHALLDTALTHLSPAVPLDGDVLVTSRTVHSLPELVEHYAHRGIRRFSIWLFSSTTQGDAPHLASLVPTLSELGPALVAARARARELGATLVSLHTPYCTVPPEAWDMQFDPRRMELFVANPNDRGFYLHDSPMERGVHVEACGSCAVRNVCRGLRPDYMAVHGTSEARPVREEDIVGIDTSGSTLD